MMVDDDGGEMRQDVEGEMLRGRMTHHTRPCILKLLSLRKIIFRSPSITILFFTASCSIQCRQGQIKPQGYNSCIPKAFALKWQPTMSQPDRYNDRIIL